jgi:hypothetical protein
VVDRAEESMVVVRAGKRVSRAVVDRAVDQGAWIERVEPTTGPREQRSGSFVKAPTLVGDPARVTIPPIPGEVDALDRVEGLHRDLSAVAEVRTGPRDRKPPHPFPRRGIVAAGCWQGRGKAKLAGFKDPDGYALRLAAPDTSPD